MLVLKKEKKISLYSSKGKGQSEKDEAALIHIKMHFYKSKIVKALFYPTHWALGTHYSVNIKYFICLVYTLCDKHLQCS